MPTRRSQRPHGPYGRAGPGRPPQFGTRCLADVVPFERTDDVAVLGRTRDLTAYLRERGTEPTRVPMPSPDTPRPFAGRDYDVVIVSAHVRRGSGTLDEVRGAVRSGGQVLLGARNRMRHVRRADAWTPGEARRALKVAGFEDVRVYGVRRSLRSPRFLVPLDDPPAQRWFMRAAFLPDSRLGALLARGSTAGPLIHLTTLLFRDLAVVGRRSEPTDS